MTCILVLHITKTSVKRVRGVSIQDSVVCRLKVMIFALFLLCTSVISRNFYSYNNKRKYRLDGKKKELKSYMIRNEIMEMCMILDVPLLIGY